MLINYFYNKAFVKILKTILQVKIVELDVIILAAGAGTRMGSSLPKVIQPLAGKPLIQHLLTTVSLLPQQKQVHLVLGSGKAEVEAVCAKDKSIVFHHQAEQLGTADAVKSVLNKLSKSGCSLILYGDVPLITLATLERLINQNKKESIVLLTQVVEDATGYGRIVRRAGEVTAIVEHKDASATERDIKEINTGIMAVRNNVLTQLIPQISNNNQQQEFYLTDIVALAKSNHLKVGSIEVDKSFEANGVNDKLQLSQLEKAYQLDQAQQLMKQGVTIIDPHRFDVRGELDVEQDVVIDINCIFQGQVTIQQGVQIGANCMIGEPDKITVIGQNTVIKPNTIIESATIGQACKIGPFARVRPGTLLADKAVLGNFVETKKATIGQGSKVNHLSYIGDTTIGEYVNVGAGTITCNYDGVNKFQTHIGDGAFIGSNTALVAPVNIQKEATVAAGSTITKDVAAGELALARSKQKNIKGWQRPRKK